MLIISRKTDEKFIIGGDIEITIVEVTGNKVRFGINAPKEVEIEKRCKLEPAASEAAEFAQPEPEERGIAAAAGASKSA